MNRDDIRDRLLLLAECSSQPHKPFNVKRKSLTKQPSKAHNNQPKLSMQDFVRMDPGYTPDIEHLVFPGRKRNPQQVAPLNPSAAAASAASKTRSRLAEMFALSRHLQQRSQDREAKARNAIVNRSVDSVVESRVGAISNSAVPAAGTRSMDVSRRWVSTGSSATTATVEEPVRQSGSSRISPVAEPDMATARGPNVSVLHLRGTSEPWEKTSPPSIFTSRAKSTVPPLTKHQSLGSAPAPKWTTSSNFHASGELKSSELFVGSGGCSRELSPVRWCDREVDGVYLGRSGWVQVQQRSLDENRRRTAYAATSSLQQSRRTGIKLADYHCHSEPARAPSERPGYLSLQPPPGSLSPPVTPIISPPPAFQDKSTARPRTFFGKTPFLPRSNAIVDSDDISPPPTPTPKWKKAQANRIPQTKSLEDTTAARRTQFMQRYGESSSSSSSSMGFRSLDSVMNRPVMPRLSENTDSSVDVYEDADEEDNNSSSLNLSIGLLTDFSRKEKISPSGRQNRLPHRQMKRSPVGSDTNKPNCSSPGSSSTSSNEFATRRTTPPRSKAVIEDPQVQRVRRSRSLQLPDKNYREPRVSPQHPPEVHRSSKRHPRPETNFTDEDMMREAEVVTGFLYGNRSRAAAQALLMHRYNNTKEEKPPPKTTTTHNSSNGLTVYFVNGKKNKRILHRGMTAPSLPPPPEPSPCQPESCDFWPHCAHRDSLMMRSSQSYPTHQRSLDAGGPKRAERRPSPSPSRPPEKASSSSSSSDVWLTTSDRTTVARSPKTEASTPVEDAKCREMILTRPGSAPAEERKASASFLESQQRSMSLPKSFLSVNSASAGVRSANKQYQQQQQQGGQFPWRRRGTESLGSSPGLPRKANSTNNEVSHTAPVTPLHEGSRRRSPLSGAVRRAKASSTPQLLEDPENRKWIEKNDSNETRLNPSSKELTRRNLPGGNTAESVLQKFRKTFSLRFHQKKANKDICNSDLGDTLSEILAEPSEEDSPQHAPPPPPSTSNTKDEQNEQKTRFGPLIWRTSKERKKLNKAARSAKCNSGDSGIQIEMVPGCGGAGDSSESHDTDPPGDELDSPPSVRRRTPQHHAKIASRPHSDLLNQILIDKFKSDLKQRAHKHNQVRRTRSDLGGQRLLHWDPRSSYRRLMSSPLRGRPQSPRKKPPDAPSGVQLRSNHNRRGQLRRSLSQPLDIDKLSPLMRTKTAGLRLGAPHVLSEDEHDGRIGTSDDEIMSDSESSIASLTERKKSLELAMDEEMVILAEAVFDHVAIEAEELAFRAGDVIEVLETANRDWWWGQTNKKSGWFPAQFVRLRVSQEDTVEDCLAAMASGHVVPSQIRRRTSISLLSNDQVRTSVVRELVHTERDFVKVLQDVAEGYIAECRKRKDMFSDEQIATIFINLEDILRFQACFLKDLEAQIDWDAPYKSCVGGCFLKHSAGFKMYSEYCNSHPMATASLQELYQFNNYSKFFEACRLMRGLIEIPLDGYLLTPVQRICKYPLQLAELLKYTKPDHTDYHDIKEALDAMRGVAVLINERKRRMESLEKLAAWQQRVEGWEGEDLIEISSQLIHQGEVVRVTTGMWTNNITLFLFDHQIVYCKKDILKRNTFVYKGRICLDTSEIIDVPDGKDNHLGVSVRHAIRLYSCIRDKWLLFCCRSSSDKQRWLQAFAEERKLVAQDKDDGLEFPPAARQLARVAARCQRRPPRKPRAGKNYKHNNGSSYTGSTFQLNANSNSLGRKVGTWFTFGGNKKSRHQSRDVS